MSSPPPPPPDASPLDTLPQQQLQLQPLEQSADLSPLDHFQLIDHAQQRMVGVVAQAGPSPSHVPFPLPSIAPPPSDVADGVSAVKVKPGYKNGLKKRGGHSTKQDPSRVNTSGEGVAEPRREDVLCGRGGLSNQHPGNEWYRRLIRSNRPLYRACLKHYKLMVATAIVHAVQQQDGRFLERDLNSGFWYPLPYKRSIDKTSQGLREIDREGMLTYAAAKASGERDKTFVPDSFNGRSNLPPNLADLAQVVIDNESRADPGYTRPQKQPPAKRVRTVKPDNLIKVVAPTPEVVVKAATVDAMGPLPPTMQIRSPDNLPPSLFDINPLKLPPKPKNIMRPSPPPPPIVVYPFELVPHTRMPYPWQNTRGEVGSYGAPVAPTYGTSSWAVSALFPPPPQQHQLPAPHQQQRQLVPAQHQQQPRGQNQQQMSQQNQHQLPAQYHQLPAQYHQLQAHYHQLPAQYRQHPAGAQHGVTPALQRFTSNLSDWLNSFWPADSSHQHYPGQQASSHHVQHAAVKRASPGTQSHATARKRSSASPASRRQASMTHVVPIKSSVTNMTSVVPTRSSATNKSSRKRKSQGSSMPHLPYGVSGGDEDANNNHGIAAAAVYHIPLDAVLPTELEQSVARTSLKLEASPRRLLSGVAS